MIRLLWAAVVAATIILSGCGTTVISSTRSTALTAPVTAATVVFVVDITSKDTNLSGGVILGSSLFDLAAASGARVGEDARAFGEEVLKLLPQALRAAGLRLDPAPLESPILNRAPSDIASLFRAPAASPVLVVRPVSARMECTNGCFVFRVEVRLLDQKSSRQLWRGSFDAPPRASRLSDFSGPAGSFSEALVAQLRKDGAIR